MDVQHKGTKTIFDMDFCDIYYINKPQNDLEYYLSTTSY